MLSSYSRYSFILAAFAAALLLWALEALVHLLAFSGSSFVDQLVEPDSNELWMRSMIAGLVIGFGIYVQAAFNRQKKQFDELQQMNRMFQTMVESMVGSSGNEFFQNTVRGLCDLLGADCAIISEIDSSRARALAMRLDGKFVDGFEYHLKGAPCGKVAEGGYSIYPERVCESFPDDEDLVEMRAEGYIGTPIRNKQGSAVGVLCAISRHRLTVPDWARGMFDIIAAKAAAEIETMRAMENRQLLLEQNRYLTRALLSAQESERRKMARDLHDEIGQTLTALKTHMALAKKFSRGERVLEQIEEGEKVVGRMFVTVRSMLESLQPTSIDELGLRAAMIKMIKAWQARSGVDCSFQIAKGVDYLDYEVAVTCYRIIQEALTNIAKHAGASHASITADLKKYDDGMGFSLHLEVSDDGCGIGEARLGMGVTGMRERIQALGGEFLLDRSNTNGTRIEARIPIFGNTDA